MTAGRRRHRGRPAAPPADPDDQLRVHLRRAAAAHRDRRRSAEMRQALGTVVFYGMIGVTFFGLFLTPVFYTVIRRLTGDRPIIPPDAVERSEVLEPAVVG
jgi:hypothetical protein